MMPLDGFECALAAIGWLARKKLIEDDPQRIDVRADIKIFDSLALFEGHVKRRYCLLPVAVIEDDNAALGSQDNIGRFNVLVNNFQIPRMLERCRDLSDDFYGLSF